MSALFDTLHADTDRTSIAPEKLMRAQLLQLFYSLRSERMLMEQLGYSRSAVCSMLRACELFGHARRRGREWVCDRCGGQMICSA